MFCMASRVDFFLKYFVCVFPSVEGFSTSRRVTVLTTSVPPAGSWLAVWLSWLFSSTSVSGKESRPLARWEVMIQSRIIHMLKSREPHDCMYSVSCYHVDQQPLDLNLKAMCNTCHPFRLCGSQPPCPTLSWLCCWSGESLCLEPSMALKLTSLWTSWDSVKPR